MATHGRVHGPLPKPDYQRRAHWGGTHDTDFAGTLYVRRVPLDRLGYTKGPYGRYFGVGAPLYRVSDDADLVDFYVRAADYEAAKADVRRMYPGVTLK